VRLSKPKVIVPQPLLGLWPPPSYCGPAICIVLRVFAVWWCMLAPGPAPIHCASGWTGSGSASATGHYCLLVLDGTKAPVVRRISSGYLRRACSAVQPCFSFSVKVCGASLYHCMQSPLVRKNKGPGPPKCQTATFCYMDSQKEAALHELNPKNNVPLSCQASGPGVPWCDNIYHTCINTSGAKRVLEYHHLIIQHSVSVAISKVCLLHIDLISQLIEADFVRCPCLKMSINRDRYSKDPLLELN
jgi:hypothetical protein